jgi:hypothetical protein
MKRKIFLIGVLTIIFIPTSLAQNNSKENTTLKSFANANIRFEQNVTDGDVEVVFDIKGGDEGLYNLSIVSPDGRTVFQFTAPDNTTLGIRQFHLESPEPKDVESIKTAYPEGIYKFIGLDAEGTKYDGEAILNHKLPETVSILKPGTGILNADISNLEISWTAVADVKAYILEIDQDELGIKITAELPSTINNFIVPEGILQANLEYTLSIGAIAKNDNRSFVETTFTTSGEE